MNLRFRPATQDVFDDVVEMLGPKRHPNAQACWCLTYRLGFKQSAKLDAPERRELVHEMCGRTPAPGVLAYLPGEEGDVTGEDGATGEVVGWAGVAPRSEVAELRSEAVYPRIDDAEPWSIFCLRTRAGRRRRGIGQELLGGAIEFARDNGAEILEAYPLDTDEKMDAIYTYPGLRSMFEKAGFEKVADTASELGGARRIVVRLDLS